MTWAWAGALVVSAFVAHWGADKLTAPLKAVRKRYGLAAAAGGALVALASASSDVAVNAVSALRGAGQIGLGNLLGSNVVSIPFVIGTAYLASRTRSLDEQGHDEHAEQGWMRVERGSVTTVALPYLALVALFAALTAVPAWRGLQPVDGVIMVVAYLAFLAQAVLRGRGARRAGQLVHQADLDHPRRAAGARRRVDRHRHQHPADRQRPRRAAAGRRAVPHRPDDRAARGVHDLGRRPQRPGHQRRDQPVRRQHRRVDARRAAAGHRRAAGAELPAYLVILAFVALMPTTYAALVHTNPQAHGLSGPRVGVLLGVLVLYVAAATTVLVIT